MCSANRLLVVDDDAGITDLITEVARGLGYAVTAVSSRDALKEAIQTAAPTVVTLDLSMPDIDGIEVLNLLADHRSRARIMLSSGLDPRVVAKAREIGESQGLTMLDDLSKPFDIAVLEQRLADSMMKEDKPVSAEDLSAAIDGGRLTVYYQPKISVKRNQAMSVVGAEALVRWNHETKGIIPPGQFIGLAEESGLILPLSDYVFREGVAFLATLLPHHPGFTLSINLSAESFTDQNLPRYLQEIADENGVPTGQICIEVTESTAMADVEKSMELMTRLRVKGFGLSLDDFGTGFSSLSYLYRMPFTELKVDRSFVSPMKENVEAATITRSVIELAHNLGLSACAEGVEDEACLETLLTYGADTAQGYFFAKPMPADEFRTFLEKPPRLAAGDYKVEPLRRSSGPGS